MKTLEIRCNKGNLTRMNMLQYAQAMVLPTMYLFYYTRISIENNLNRSERRNMLKMFRKQGNEHALGAMMNFGGQNVSLNDKLPLASDTSIVTDEYSHMVGEQTLAFADSKSSNNDVEGKELKSESVAQNDAKVVSNTQTDAKAINDFGHENSRFDRRCREEDITVGKMTLENDDTDVVKTVAHHYEIVEQTKNMKVLLKFAKQLETIRKSKHPFLSKKVCSPFNSSPLLM